MGKRVLILFVIGMILLSFSLVIYLTEGKEEVQTTLPEWVVNWKYIKSLDISECPEPSGICFDYQSKTFYVVDDGAITRPAGVYQVDKNGNILRKANMGKDLEGVTINPETGYLYIVDEWDDSIYEVEPVNLTVTRNFKVDHSYGGNSQFLKDGGNGLEGITFVVDKKISSGGFFYLVNQDDPPCVIKVILPDEELSDDVLKWVISSDGETHLVIMDAYLLPPLNTGECLFIPEKNELMIAHSWQNIYELLKPETFEVIGFYSLPGVAQEGICFDDEGNLWIASDLGGIHCYKAN